MKNIGNKELGQLEQEMLVALESVGKKNGVKFSLGRGRYGGTFATLQVEIGLAGSNGQSVSRQSELFKKYAGSFDLKPTDLGRVFVVNGKQFKVDGLEPRRPVRPVLGTRVPDGKRFKFTAEQVKQGLQ